MVLAVHSNLTWGGRLCRAFTHPVWRGEGGEPDLVALATDFSGPESESWP